MHVIWRRTNTKTHPENQSTLYK